MEAAPTPSRPSPSGPSAPRRAVIALVSLTALFAAAPASAQAIQQLQGCGLPGQGELPIGNLTQWGHDWKSTLVTWMAGTRNLPSDPFLLDQNNPVNFLQSATAYGVNNAPFGNLCPYASFTVPPGPAEKRDIFLYHLLTDAENGAGANFTLSPFLLNQADNIYFLDQITDQNNCVVKTPALEWDPGLTWMANWRFPGNPFYTNATNREAIKARGAVWLALQLIMLDWAEWSANSLNFPPLTTQPQPGRSFVHPQPGQGPYYSMNYGFELGGYLGHLAYAYLQVQDSQLLTNVERDALKKGLRMLAERLYVWGPGFQQTNLAIRATYGYRYAWMATGAPDILGYYQQSLSDFFSPTGLYFHEAGYFSDDGGFDASYNQHNLNHMIRLLLLDSSSQPLLRNAAERSFDLTAHMEFLDADNRWIGPSEFNSRTGQGVVNGATPSRRLGESGGELRYLPAVAFSLPFADAFMADATGFGPLYSDPGYLAARNYSGFSNLTSGTTGLDPRPGQGNYDFYLQLACFDNGNSSYLNNNWMANGYNFSYLDPPPAPRGIHTWPQVPGARNYVSPPTVADFLTPAWAAKLWDDIAANPAAALMPVQLPGPYLRNFKDEFVFAKFGTQAADQTAMLLHVGPVGPAGGGYGGGELSAFWTPSGGPMILGRRRGRNNPPDIDIWPEWRRWPIHAVTLLTSSDVWTSSARIESPSTQVYLLPSAPSGSPTPVLRGNGQWASPGTVPEAQATAALVRVAGAIPTSGHAIPSGAVTTALSGGIKYTRAFLLSQTEVAVRTFVDPGSSTLLKEAWESLPLWNRDSTHQPTLTDATVKFVTNGPPFVVSPGDTTLYAGVSKVIVTRAGGTMIILFDAPQRAAMSDVWVQGSLNSRTLLVDLLPSGSGPRTLAQKEVIWHIRH